MHSVTFMQLCLTNFILYTNAKVCCYVIMYNIFPPSGIEFELGLVGFNTFLAYYYLPQQIDFDMLHT